MWSSHFQKVPPHTSLKSLMSLMLRAIMLFLWSRLRMLPHRRTYELTVHSWATLLICRGGKGVRGGVGGGGDEL